jgi:hypothetical protein
LTHYSLCDILGAWLDFGLELDINEWIEGRDYNKMKHFLRLFVLAVVLTTLVGCASSGKFNSTNLTNVELSESNFRLVATNVSGEASAEYLLGFSVAQGGEMQTVGLIPLGGGDRLLYQMALANLWQNFAQTHGNIEGKSLALANVRFDSEAVNVLFFYTRPKISVRADVIEFVE